MAVVRAGVAEGARVEADGGAPAAAWSAPASTTGSALVRVRVRLSATGGLVPSSAVRVRVQVPSSVQLTLVAAAVGLPKVQRGAEIGAHAQGAPEEARRVVAVGHAAREGDRGALGRGGVVAGVDDRWIVGPGGHGDRSASAPAPVSSSVTVTVTVYVPGAL